MHYLFPFGAINLLYLTYKIISISTLWYRCCRENPLDNPIIIIKCLLHLEQSCLTILCQYVLVYMLSFNSVMQGHLQSSFAAFLYLISVNLTSCYMFQLLHFYDVTLKWWLFPSDFCDKFPLGLDLFQNIWLILAVNRTHSSSVVSCIFLLACKLFITPNHMSELFC